MKSTNSHAFEFANFPATRVAWPNHQAELMGANGGLGAAAFTSVIVGVVDAAMDYMRPRIKNALASAPGLRAYQQVEWAYAEQEAWLIGQAWGRRRPLPGNRRRPPGTAPGQRKAWPASPRIAWAACANCPAWRLHPLLAPFRVVR